MYGTIMRAKIKSGRKDEYVKLLDTFVPSADDYGQGIHSIELAWEDKDPDRVVAVIHFRDRDSYRANAERPETNADYEKQREFFDGDPEWIDVNYEKYVGKPLGEETAARS